MSKGQWLRTSSGGQSQFLTYYQDTYNCVCIEGFNSNNINSLKHSIEESDVTGYHSEPLEYDTTGGTVVEVV